MMLVVVKPQLSLIWAMDELNPTHETVFQPDLDPVRMIGGFR